MTSADPNVSIKDQALAKVAESLLKRGMYVKQVIEFGRLIEIVATNPRESNRGHVIADRGGFLSWQVWPQVPDSQLAEVMLTILTAENLRFRTLR